MVSGGPCSAPTPAGQTFTWARTQPHEPTHSRGSWHSAHLLRQRTHDRTAAGARSASFKIGFLQKRVRGGAVYMHGG